MTQLSQTHLWPPIRSTGIVVRPMSVAGHGRAQPQGPSAVVRFRRRSSLSVTNWAARIYRERLDLESRNFTRRSIPTLDTTSLTASGRKLSRKKNPRKCRLWRLRMEFLVNNLNEVYELSNTYHKTVRYNIPIAAAYGQLQNVIQYCTKVRKTVRPAKIRVIRLLFHIESPKFTRTSRPVV